MLDPHPSADSRIATVMDRWQQFHQQIAQRFAGILAEAEEACSLLLAHDEDDPNAMSVAWTSAHGRAVDLGACLTDAWNDQFEPRLQLIGAGNEVLVRVRVELEALQDRMEVDLEHTRLRIFAEAARIRWIRALRDAPSQLHCPLCGARQPIPATFGPSEVGCPDCETRVVYRPSPRVHALAPACVHALCEEAAWEPWLAMRRAEHELHAAPCETIELLAAYEHAQIAYWHTYLQTRVSLVPHTARSFADDLRNLMQPWYQHVEHRTAWAHAGRPRTLQ